MQIPKPLIDQIRTGGVVLFLGAGASKGAVHPDSKTIPNGAELAQIIADKFLGHEFANRPLGQVADLAISERDLVTVQSLIKDLFQDFGPANFHKLIPKFAWAAIATTNYDLVIEKAYDQASDRVQLAVPFRRDGERIEPRLRNGDAILLKLHGCISTIDDDHFQLILTPDQYVTHRKGRERLFNRLRDLAREYPFLFVGHSLEDPDLRAILLELDELGEAKS